MMIREYVQTSFGTEKAKKSKSALTGLAIALPLILCYR